MVVCQREIWNQKPETICREDTINDSCKCLWNQSVESGVIQVWVICIQEIDWTNKTQGIKPHRLWISWDLIKPIRTATLWYGFSQRWRMSPHLIYWWSAKIRMSIYIYTYNSPMDTIGMIVRYTISNVPILIPSERPCFSRRLQNLKFASKVRPSWQIGQRGWNANWRVRWLSL